MTILKSLFAVVAAALLLVGWLPLVSPADAQIRAGDWLSFNLCNVGTETVDVAVVHPIAFLSITSISSYRASGWQTVQGGSCRDLALGNYGIHYFLFAKRLPGGTRVRITGGPINRDGSTIQATSAEFCVHVRRNFRLEGNIYALARCEDPDTYQVIPFNLAVTPSNPGTRATYRINPDRARWVPFPNVEAERRQRAEERRRQQLEAEIRAFELARSSRRLADVNAYLGRYPDGAYVREVRQIHAELDAAAFRDARGRNTVAAFEQYLRNFSRGRHVTEARAAVAAFDEAAFRSARAQHTKEAYEAYLRAYPRGNHRAAAEEGLRAIDRDAFAEATRSGSVGSYESYLGAFPRGRYARQARTLIDVTRQVEQTELEIRTQRTLLNGARGRANVYGVTSVAALGGAGVLAYAAYRKYDAATVLESEMEALDRGSNAYQETKTEFDQAIRSLVVYGAGAVAALYVTRATASRRAAHRREASLAGSTLRQLEQRQEGARTRIRELSTVQLSVVPTLNHRLEPGLSLVVRF